MRKEKTKRKISISRKIFQYLLVSTLFSLILLGSFWIEREIIVFQREVQILKNTYSEYKKAEIKNKILGIKDWIYWIQSHPPEYVTGMVPGLTIDLFRKSDQYRDILQKYCLDSLSRIRFGKDEYIFVNSLDGKALVSNGKYNIPPVDILTSGDTAWIRIFRIEQLAAVKEGGFFYTYSFKKISELTTSLKTSFFSYLPEWNWIIGTGFYKDDLNSIIELKREALILSLRKNLFNFAPFLLILFLLNYLIVMFFSKRLAKNITLFKDFFAKAVDEHNLIDKSRVSYKEFENLADTANLMVKNSVKAEDSLRLSEERYRYLFERNPAPMAIYDPVSLDLLAGNEAFFNLYGYLPEDVPLLHLPDFYPYDEKGPIVDLVKGLKGHRYTGEWHHVKKNGSVFPIITTSHDLVYMGIPARIVVITDITERKKVEAEASFLAQVLRNINEFVSITDLDNRITFVNQSWLKTFGYRNKEVIGQKIDIIVSPTNRSGIVDEILSETLSGGWNGEVLNRKKDGSEFTVQLVTTIIYDNAGQPVALVGISNDITFRKKAEEELKLHRDHLQELVISRTADLEKEKENALSADRLKSAFLATMSHELRTPLNSIIGFTGILMQERPGPLNDEQKKQLGMAQNSARHLLSLINDVLDISKIEAGQLKMNLQQFNLRDVINKVVETNKPFADKKNLRITVSIEDNVRDIISDILRVQQILLNLVNNAIKFTEIGTISINCFPVSNYVKIQVTDSGIGIESEKLELLFKPFSQIDTGLTRKHEGTGLGLSICKKLTEMLKGKIEVESKYGSGSTFTISLPIM
jgi:PAS domain S-box-containing protein